MASDIYSTPLGELTSAELHAEGLGWLARARQNQPASDRAANAGLAQAFFFAALSADNLDASARAAERASHRVSDRDPGDPRVRGDADLAEADARG
jgi:hypothetical protein